ncbi:Fibronectin type III domain-containing protein [Thermosyntropha lipolytica DSM 11003]|uniref:Fibronectin type III domain-containing protein n=2 Tax=Thermosyntropha TaxID=54293 RepID=A0A1M5JP91_9FIRM|nr:Fibronectin type III domain-containing protein [Thermosyntropha lipolytica DSM 11003]
MILGLWMIAWWFTMATFVQAVDTAQLDSSIQFIRPSGNIAIIGGMQYPVQWDASGSISSVSLYYESQDGWTLIDTVSGNPGSYLWNVPTPPGHYIDTRLKLVVCKSSWQGIPPMLVLRYYYNTSDLVRIANPHYVFPPNNLNAEALSSTSIKLTWNDNSSNETGFGILQIGSGGTLTKIAQVNADTTSYVVEGLAPATEYSFSVYAFNPHYASYPSNIATATTLSETVIPTPPAKPSDLAATPHGKEAIYLSWTDNATDETAFIIERSLYPDRDFTEIALLPADTIAYKNTGLNPGTFYYFRVKARNSAGDSEYSNIAGAQTLAEVEPPPATEAEEGIETPSLPKSIVLRFYIDSQKYYVDDLPAALDTAPVIQNRRTLLPIRYVAEPLGAEVGWSPDEQKVTIQMGDKKLELWINQNTARVNGFNKSIDPDNSRVTPIILPPGRTMMPLRFIAENLGCQVDWNESTREVRITYNEP